MKPYAPNGTSDGVQFPNSRKCLLEVKLLLTCSWLNDFYLPINIFSYKVRGKNLYQHERKS